MSVQLNGRNERQSTYTTTFEGVIPNLERRYRETNSEFIRNKITEFMTDRPCQTCNGNRLRPEALAVTVDDCNIVEVTNWPVARAWPGSTGWAARIHRSICASRPSLTVSSRRSARAWVSWWT